jgi:hypothetical protein
MFMSNSLSIAPMCHMRLFILSLLLSFTSSLYSAMIDRINIQYAGEIGLVAMGLGKKVSHTYSFDVFYGYVPESIAGSEIETYAFKNQWNWIAFEHSQMHFQWYGGLNFYHVIGLRYQSSRLISYPRNYYSMSSIRALLLHGLLIRSSKSRHQYYIETGINDFWLINWMNNQDVINGFDYFSWSVGWRYPF